MQFEHWLAFVATYTVLSLIPGPSVIMAISQALSRGKRAAFMCIAGDLLGGVFLIALSLFGVGAILATSALAFQLVKWAGVFYLAYIGFSQMTQARKHSENPFAMGTPVKDSAAITSGFLTGVLNPKAIIFYMAFLSQFMDPAAPIAEQFGILILTSSLIVGIVLSGYALFAVQARAIFHSAKARRRFGYSSGGMLIGSSVYVAVTR